MVLMKTVPIKRHKRFRLTRKSVVLFIHKISQNPANYPDI